MMRKWKRFASMLLTVVMLTTMAVPAYAATLTLPQSLKEIQDQAFEGDKSIDDVVLPDGITTIGSRAFANSTIGDINLPRSLKSIAADAFAESPNVKAQVKAGSYAEEYCEENNIPHETEAIVLPSSSTPVSLSVDKTTVAMGDCVEITLTSDDGSQVSSDVWMECDVTYFDANGDALFVENYGYEELGTYSVWPECAGAAKMIISIVKTEDVCAGETPSVEVQITNSDAYPYYLTRVDGMAYPGGKMRVNVIAKNADKISGSKTVVVTDNLGSFTTTMGTLSATNAVVSADVVVPRTFDVYDEEGNENDYYFIFQIEGEGNYRHWPNMRSFCDPFISVAVGRTNTIDYEMLPAEMPYTYAIADTTIATINSYGEVTGVKAGTTTGTLTTKSGLVNTFEVTVREVTGGDDVGVPVQEPVFYAVAPAPTYMYDTDEEPIFLIMSATENSLELDEDIPITFNFYDDDNVLIDSVGESQWVNHGDNGVSVWTDWGWWDDAVGEKYRYIELVLDEEEIGYEVIEPSSARVRVVYPEDLGQLAFWMDDQWGEYNPGDTATITLTCTTPELLAQQAGEGDVKVTIIPNYGENNNPISAVQPAVFDADTLTATLTFTIADDVLPGKYYYLALYCGDYKVGTYSLDIYAGLNAVPDSNLLVGERVKLPISIADEAMAERLYFWVEDTSIATVDADGYVTALAPGYTGIDIYYQTPYGLLTSVWTEVYVYEPAGEDLPALTYTLMSTEAQFGKPVQVKVQLSENITDEAGNPAEIRFYLRTNYLDKNGVVSDNLNRRYTYDADELTGEGKIVSINYWPESGIYSFDKMTLVLGYSGDDNDVVAYKITQTGSTLPITGIPKPGEVFYQLIPDWDEDEELRKGNYLYFNVDRIPSTIGKDVEIALRDADGVLLVERTLEDGDSGIYFGFSTSTMQVGEVNTVYLYVDDVKISDAFVNFTLTEPEIYLDVYGSRLGVGDTTFLEYHFYGGGYTCDMTVTSSDPTVLSVSVDETDVELTAHKSGTATVTVSCKHGQSASQTYIVYDENGTVVPVVSILPTENHEQDWMHSIPFRLNIVGDLVQIPMDYMSLYYYVQFLDEDMNVLFDSRNKESGLARHLDPGVYDIYCGLQVHQWDENGWIEDWMSGAEMDARYIRLTLMKLSASHDDYIIDEAHSQITYPLESIAEYDQTIVKTEYPKSLGRGQSIEVTFTCLNPKSLKEGKEVTLWDADGYYEDEEPLVRGMLTKSNPVVTLTYTPDADFRGGSFYIVYPNGYGQTQDQFYVQTSELISAGDDRKLRVGNTGYAYPEFYGAEQEFTYTVSDDTIVSVEKADNGYREYLMYTALKAGKATITVTTLDGQQKSLEVVVYDSNNITVPSIYIDANNVNNEVSWNNTIYFAVGTDTDTSLFGDLAIQCQIEYLDADGKTVSSQSFTGYSINDFVKKSEFIYVNVSKLGQLYAEGARSVRVTLTESDSYTFDENRASMTIPFPDPAAATSPICYYTLPDYLIIGETFTLTIGCINPTVLTRDMEYTAYHDYNDKKTITLNAANPVGTQTFVVPADYNSDSYRLYIEGQNLSVGEYIPVLSGYVSGSGPVEVGSSRSLSYYVYAEVDGFTAVWESANPEIATVDQSGTVTGVAAGQTDIYVHYGPLTLTGGVRVYDSDAQETAPEIYITTENELLKPGTSINYVIGTNTDLADLTKQNYSIYYEVTGINDAGEVVFVRNDSWSDNLDFAEDNEESDSFYFNTSDLIQFVMAGATKVRFRLLEMNWYTIDSERASIVVPIQDTSEWSGNYVGIYVPKTALRGETVTVPVRWLVIGSSYANKTCTFTLNVTDQNGNYLIENEQIVLSAESPDASVTFTMPQDAQNVRVQYAYRYEGSSYDNGSGSYSCSAVYFTATPADEVLAIGEEFYPTYSGGNYGSVRRCESSNPAVATVNNNGKVTAVSAGITEITMYFDKLVDTYKVRVYDPEQSYDAPHLYLSNAGKAIKPGDYAPMIFSTTTEAEQLGAGVTVDLKYEYLDAVGNVVRLGGTTSVTVAFAVDTQAERTAYLYADDVVSAVVAGATQIRYTMQENAQAYTFDANRASAIVPITNPSTWDNTYIGWDAQQFVYGNEPITVNVKMLSFSGSDAAKNFVCSFYVNDSNWNRIGEYEDVILNAANPTATYVVPCPQSSSFTVGYTLREEGSSYNRSEKSKTVYPVYITTPAPDFTVKVGSSKKMNYSGSNLTHYSLIKSYESSNPEIATVNTSGAVTGVSAGVATITVHFGELVDTVKVRVYDNTTAQPKFSLTAPETLTAWKWDNSSELIISADQPVESISGVDSVYVSMWFYDADGRSVGGSSYQSVGMSLVDSNTQAVRIPFASMENCAKSGAVSVKISLTSNSNYTINSEASKVELPMQPLSEVSNPMILVATGLSSSNMISGKQYTMTVEAGNTTVSTPQTVKAYTTISGTRYDLGSVTFTPSETAQATLTVTAPSGVTTSSFTMYLEVPVGNGEYAQYNQSYYCSLTALPAVKAVTTLADLQSEHDYKNNMNEAWSYTVEGATSLSVTFDSQTCTEAAHYDPLKVGSLAAFEEGNLENTYGGDNIGGITANVTGDTVVIWLKSDGSSVRYGFAVTQIVATMADGSTVTITE